MKRNILTLALLLALGSGLQAQSPIEQVLKNIETNNKELQANQQLIAAQKLEAQAENNLPNPTLSYAHLWGADNKDETIGELVISQSFDFPSLYFTRKKINRLKSNSYDSEAELFRQTVLLQAKELCLDIIWLRRQKAILDKRLQNAETLSKMYAERLQTGDANTMEINKINLELLNVKTEATMNQSALVGKLQALRALNGNVPIEFNEEEYPNIQFPSDYAQLKTEVIGADRTLQSLQAQSIVAQKQVKLNKSQWLPQLELGYRRNTETGEPYNGIVVGFSFPIFENRHKVKIAKTQALNIDLQKENATLQAEAELAQLYEEAKNLHVSMEEYQKTFRSQQDLNVLRKALDGGEISMIEYFVEVAVIYQSQLNYLQLENQYQKAMAQIYKNRL